MTDTCEIYCINRISVDDIKFSCRECKKSVCKSCYILSLKEENEKLKIINEELTYCDGTSRSDNDSRLQLKIELVEYQRDRANKELMNFIKKL